MKILIMGFAKIKYMPYVNFYLDQLLNDAAPEHEIHLLYWNRDLKQEDTDRLGRCILHEFRCYQEDDVSRSSKIGNFLKYRKFAKKVLKRERFDFIFVLHSMPGVLLADTLTSKYRQKYVFDYRDSTYEHFLPYKKVIGALVKHSRATFVSSDGFRRFLPEKQKAKIHTSHNLLTDSLSHRDQRAQNGCPSDKIRIAFWGFIRHEQINRVLIERIAKDDRFELHYYGREQQVAFHLKAFAAEIHAENVRFHGEYKPEDRYEFVKNTDLIHNVYLDSNTLLAMGNKYYDGAIFRIPQICMPGSFMGDRATKAGIGCAIDPRDPDFTEQVYRYYTSLDPACFKKSCDDELERILSEYREGILLIKDVLKETR